MPVFETHNFVTLRCDNCPAAVYQEKEYLDERHYKLMALDNPYYPFLYVEGTLLCGVCVNTFGVDMQQLPQA